MQCLCSYVRDRVVRELKLRGKNSDARSIKNIIFQNCLWVLPYAQLVTQNCELTLTDYPLS